MQKGRHDMTAFSPHWHHANLIQSWKKSVSGSKIHNQISQKIQTSPDFVSKLTYYSMSLFTTFGWVELIKNVNILFKKAKTFFSNSDHVCLCYDQFYRAAFWVKHLLPFRGLFSEDLSTDFRRKYSFSLTATPPANSSLSVLFNLVCSLKYSLSICLIFSPTSLDLLSSVDVRASRKAWIWASSNLLVRQSLSWGNL